MRRPTDQVWTFYEIDPAVVRISQDRRYFTFLDDTRAKFNLVLGDARLSLMNEASNEFDLLILDAFSSDAIPVHLLTREALAIYQNAVAEDGLLAFHISNRHLALQPVLARLATDRELTALVRNDPIIQYRQRLQTIAGQPSLAHTAGELRLGAPRLSSPTPGVECWR